MTFEEDHEWVEEENYVAMYGRSKHLVIKNLVCSKCGMRKNND